MALQKCCDGVTRQSQDPQQLIERIDPAHRHEQGKPQIFWTIQESPKKAVSFLKL